MQTYPYRCTLCDESFSLKLTDAEHEAITRALREGQPYTLRNGEVPHCPSCVTADLVPMSEPKDMTGWG